MPNQTTIDQLNEAVDALLAGREAQERASGPEPRDVEFHELLTLAAELKMLPDPEFKAALGAGLLGELVAGDDLHSSGEAQGAGLPIRGAAKSTRAVGPIGVLPTFARARAELYPVQRSSFMASVAAHGAVLALIVTCGIWAAPGAREVPRVSSTVSTDVSPYILPSAGAESGGGGGGGARDKVQASKGNPPRFAREQIAPPALVVRNEVAKLEIEPTVVGPPSISFPKTELGDPLSGVVGPASNGTGGGGGIGDGHGGGVGPGYGPGVGPGSGGGIGGGIYRVGGGVSAPRPIYDPEPEYSEEGRKAKHQGTVLLQVVVGSDGRPRDVRVVRSLGMGLDEKALEGVRQWRFDPARKDGRPVAVMVNIEVNFRLY